MKTIRVYLSVNQVVQRTGMASHTLIASAECISCGAKGLVDYKQQGFPHNMKLRVSPNRLVHKNRCPMNNHLTQEGELKQESINGSERRVIQGEPEE